MNDFRDRSDAGRALAKILEQRSDPDPVILALPRGGVPVAAEIARALEAPLDLVMVRKIGVPTQPELAAGAVVNGSNPEIVRNESIMRSAGLGDDDIEALAEVQLEEIARRRARYLGGRPPLELRDKTVIVVDDGIATGATMRAALAAIRRKSPARLIMAVPVAPVDTLKQIKGLVDEAICLQTPEIFHAVGAHYADFAQVSDDEVVRIMRAHPRD